MTIEQSYKQQLTSIIQAGNLKISNVLPSVWTGENVHIKGKLFSYGYTPYTSEIVDCLAPDHPAHEIAVEKGSQVGGSAGVIVAGLLWSIKNNPMNTYYMVGHEKLVEKAVTRLDLGIDGAGLRALIASQTQRNKSQKTGDTNFLKEYAGGYTLIGYPANFKSIAQDDVEFIILDDLDMMKAEAKEEGDVIDLYRRRAATYKHTYKMLLVSTPLTKQKSLIEPAFLRGDQRYYNIHCPHCHKPIVLKWDIKIDEKESAGIYWKPDGEGGFIESSVGYICQLCGGFFKDNNKMKMLQEGFWHPTAVPKRMDYYSYHLSSLYAPSGMFGWKEYVSQYIEAHPIGQPRLENKYKVFVNTVLGLAYEPRAQSQEAKQITKNIREYLPGTIPESLSIADGNGRIVLLTCGADLNGKMKGFNSEENDARLDYEILAHSETGATYSILHGSIGTFISRQGSKVTDRTHWTYEHNKTNNVWTEFDKIISQVFITDTGREIMIHTTALDTGAYATTGAYPFIDKCNSRVFGVKGEKEEQYIMDSKDSRIFKKSLERPKDCYILNVSLIKDWIAQFMGLNWDRASGNPQPPNFMNYPAQTKYICPIKADYSKRLETPYDGDFLYQVGNYFEHYEGEVRKWVKGKDGIDKFKWEKKTSASQNHMLDCRVYAMGAKEIFLARAAIAYDVKSLTWEEYCSIVIKWMEK